MSHAGEDSMTDEILVLNGGSSSLKFSIYWIDDQEELALAARGRVENIGNSPHFKAVDRKGNVLADAHLDDGSAVHDGHAGAFAAVIKWARKQFDGSVSQPAIGHRVVHGGMEFAEPVVIDDAVLERLDCLVPLAPLHQPHNLALIRTIRQLRPDLPQVACFDTAFHRGRSTV